MKRIALLTFIAMSALAMVGCGSGEKAAETAADAGGTAQKFAAKAVETVKTIADGEGITCEVACAGCIYHMDGVEGCTPAVKMVDGEPMLLKGVPVDAHGLGLCKAAQEATVMGEMKEGAFVASAVELK